MLILGLLSIALAEGVEVSGDVRLTTDTVSPFVLDELGTTVDRPFVLRSRVILGMRTAVSSNTHLLLGVEGLSGQIAGATTDIGTSIGDDVFRVSRTGPEDLWQVWPRALAIQHKMGRLNTSVGVQTFHWGLGMLSNDGLQSTTFGEANQGNIYLRGALAGAPVLAENPEQSIRLFFATDWILRDDNVSVYDGDTAYQVITGVMQQRNTTYWSFLSGARYQKDREDIYHPDGRTTGWVVPFDFHGKQVLGPMAFELEAVQLMGRTNRIYSEQTRGETSKLQATGFMFQLAPAEKPEDEFAVWASGIGGFASGDNNPTDGVAREFSMHSNANAGLLLFDEIIPMISANAVDRITDPGLSAQPPASLRYAVNQGTVSGSAYLQLLGHVQYKRTKAKLGYLYAHRTAALADPYTTGISGGYPVGFGGVDVDNRSLGHEIDLRLRAGFGQQMRYVLVGEGGYFIPGSALSGVLDSPVWGVHSRLQIQWGAF